MIKIGFCGATHLGLCYSAAAVDKGFEAICFDFDKKKIQSFNNNEIDVDEPNLLKLIIKNRRRLNFTNDIKQLSSCDFVYFSYDVNTNSSGVSDQVATRKKLENLINNLKKKIPIVILSQVPPGFTRKYLRKKNKLYYQVETLVFGNAVFRALNPERFIIGSYIPKKKLFHKYDTFLKSFKCPVINMKYESAELAKIAINCYLASSVSITNTLAEVSETIGADWEEIIPTLMLDRRIGKFAYLKPGLGISGGNIERDLTTIKNLGKRNGSNINLINSIINLSKYSKMWLSKKVTNYLLEKPNLKIGVLGLAYKENTNSTKNSPALLFLNNIKKQKVKVYDPLVKNINLNNIIETRSAYEAAEDSDLLVIATPFKEFKDLDYKALKSKMVGNIIIDPYKLLYNRALLKLGFKHHFLG